MELEKHFPMVHKLAWSFHRTTGLDVDDLTSEGFVALVSAHNRYDDSRNAKFGTFVYLAVSSQLMNYCQRQKKYALQDPLYIMTEGEEVELPVPALFEDPTAEKQTLFKQSFDALEEVAKKLCTFIWNGTTTKSEAMKQLRKEGVSWNEINRACDQVREMLVTVG